MTLIEAIKSGRPLRRLGKITWARKTCHGEHRGNILCDAMHDHWMSPSTVLEIVILRKEDVLADDWEIQTPAVTITREQFWDAVRSSTSAKLGTEIALTYADIEKLARKLGLE